MFNQQRNYRNNRKNQNSFHQGSKWDNRDQYTEKMGDR